MEEKELYALAIKTFGWNNQVDMLIEEMAELTQALLKHRRKPESIEVWDNLHEEFADVNILLNQIKHGLNENMVYQHKTAKLNRLAKLIENHK